MPGCTPQMGWFRQSVAITRKLGLCSASVAVHWQQWEPLWMGRRGAFNGFYCAMGPPDLLLDKFDIKLKARTHSRKCSTPEDWNFCCALLCLPTRKFSFTVTCPSVGASLCLSFYLIRGMDYFQIPVCTGPERMGRRSSLKDSAYSAKAMEDITGDTATPKRYQN